MTGQPPDLDKLYAAAAECPDGFTPVLQENGVLYFVADYWLKELPPEVCAKMRIIKPH